MKIPASSMEDMNLEVARLQKEIESYLNLGNTSIIFDYKERNGHMKLYVITINPRHNQSFLFHATEGIDKKDCLLKMLDYVKNYRTKENSYTIQWAIAGENELHTSYFRAKDIMEAIEKLYFGRDPNSIVIYSAVLNPIS